MKKTYLITAIISISAVLVLTGCESTPTTPPQTQQTPSVAQETQEKSGGFHIYQINKDGTSQEITGSLNAETSKPAILEGTKGMIITDKGFAPDTLTITPGTKVIIQNKDSKEHWPISDPSHAACADFDSKKGLAPEETYEFTFEKVETCVVHDHLNQNLKATIVIKE